jgi:hypothetical protein
MSSNESSTPLKESGLHSLDDLMLDPPTVNVLRPLRTTNDGSDDDSDDDNNDIELWTFRVPVQFKIASLHGMDLNLRELKKAGETGIRIQAASKTTNSQQSAPTLSSSQPYSIVIGDTIENESFRALIPSESKLDNARNKSDEDDDEDSDDDSDDRDSSSDDDLHMNDSDDDSEGSSRKKKAKKNMKTKSDGDEPGTRTKAESDNSGGRCLHFSSKPFTRHFNVIKDFPHMSETQMAPLKGPKSVEPMRRAYTPIPQRKGLKRRWIPPGGKKSEDDASADPMMISMPAKSKKVEKDTVETVTSAKKNVDNAVSSSSSSPLSPTKKKWKAEEEQVPGTSTSEDHGQLSTEERKALKKAAKREKKEKKQKKKKRKKEADTDEAT